MKFTYMSSNRDAVIINSIPPDRDHASIATMVFLDLNALKNLLLKAIEDADKAGLRYTVSHKVLAESSAPEADFATLFNELGFELVSDPFHVFERKPKGKPVNPSDTPHDIRAAHYDRDDRLIVNSTIEGGPKDDRYVIRNSAGEILQVVDSLREAESILKS